MMIPGVKYKNFKFLGWLGFPLYNATLRGLQGLSGRTLNPFLPLHPPHHHIVKAHLFKMDPKVGGFGLCLV